MGESQTGLYNTIGDFAYANEISDTYASNKPNSVNDNSVDIEFYLNKYLEYEEVIELLKLFGT